MASYTFRQQAVEAAHKLGFVGFRTVLDLEIEMWKIQDHAKKSPASYMEAFEWVHHAEAQWVDNRLVGVLIVNVTKEELAEEGTVRQDEHGVWLTPTGDDNEFLCEPMALECWDLLPPETKVNKASTGSSGPRERSSIESPVKTVWRIADEMSGSPRKDVIAACIAAGVNKSTANTQYYHWSKAQNPA